ncbi:MAG TPA: PKD domain-containing protein, partial [Anseongella sp.]|nr:PKD domain-containing protein [Anseongella sp.]
VRIPREPDPLAFRVPEQAVIADFYLPYTCCSDCAPLSYVLPKPPEAQLSIGIQPTEFCRDDTRAYPVSVSPAGGELAASGGGLSEENGFLFSPKDAAAGINKLTYTLADGRSTSIDLLVAENFEVQFRTRDLGDLTLQFIPAFAQNGREIRWDFGDGQTSSEFSPAHTYSFEGAEASFTVKLSVTDAPCTAEAEQTITVRKAVEKEFDLQPRDFCVNDRREYDFTIQPFPGNIAEISNRDKLILTVDEAGKRLVFVPAKHRIQSSKVFHLEYQGIGLDVQVVVADASFTMQVRSAGQDSLLILKGKQTGASNYDWTVSQGRVTHSFEGQVRELKLSDLKINPARAFIISFRLNHQLPSGNCSAEQKFEMTPEIFRKHRDGAEFDNTTR